MMTPGPVSCVSSARRARSAGARPRPARPTAVLGMAVLLGLAAVGSPASGAPAPPPGPTRVVFDHDVQVGGDQTFAGAWGQREASIAFNRTNPDNMVAVFKDRYPDANSPPIIRIAYSDDGARSWTAAGITPLEELNAAATDPSVASTLDGTFYAAYVHLHNDSQGYITRGDIAVARSTDGGRTFTDPTFPYRGTTYFCDVGGGIPDKPYLGVDANPKSRYRDTIYVAYVANDDCAYQIMVSASHDRGATWSIPVRVSRQASFFDSDDVIEGPIPVVAPDGTAYVFYEYSYGRVGPSDVKFVKSKDGGRTWSAAANAAASVPAPSDWVIKNANPQFGTVSEAGSIVSFLPTPAIGPDGTIYVVWNDLSNGHCVDLGGFPRPTCYNTDIRMTLSRDGGKSWTPPVRVNDDVGENDQMYPWIAVHPDGLLSIMWLDKRLDPDNINYDAFYTNTRDGVHFLPNVRVSTQSSEVGQSFNYGDYMGMTATADTVVPIWNDLRKKSTIHVYAARGVLQF
jgi:BNR repeat-like domain